MRDLAASEFEELTEDDFKPYEENTQDLSTSDFEELSLSDFEPINDAKTSKPNNPMSRAMEGTAKKGSTYKQSMPAGVDYKGNIDLDRRSIFRDRDGIRTENSIGINVDGKETIIPTVVGGKQLSEEDAKAHFFKTGEHLGQYDTVEEANTAANNIHLRQQNKYGNMTASELHRIDVENLFDKQEKDRAKALLNAKNTKDYDKAEAEFKDSQNRKIWTGNRIFKDDGVDRDTKAMDYAASIMGGFSGLLDTTGHVMTSLSADKKNSAAYEFGTEISKIGKEATEWWESQKSKDAKLAVQDKLLGSSVGETIHNVLNNPQATMLSVTDSTAGTMAGMAMGGALSKMFTLIPSIGTTVANAMGYGLGEGALGAAEAHKKTSRKIENMKEADLVKAPEYKALVNEFGGDTEKAREVLAAAMAGDEAALTFATTTILSAPMGVLVGRFMSKGNFGDSFGTSMAFGTVGEMGQEAGQSGFEKINENFVIGKYENPEQPLMQGVGEAALKGGLSGGVMGAGMAAAGEVYQHTPTGQRAKTEQGYQEIADLMDSYNFMPSSAQEDAAAAHTRGTNQGLRLFNEQAGAAKATWETATPEQKQAFKQEMILAVQSDPEEAIKEIAGLIPYLSDEQGTDIINAAAEVLSQDEINTLQELINNPQLQLPAPQTQPKAEEPIVETALTAAEAKELEELEAAPEDELDIDAVWRMEDLQMKRDGAGQGEQEGWQEQPNVQAPTQEVTEDEKQLTEAAAENEQPALTRPQRIAQAKKHPRFKEVVEYIEAARGYEANRVKRQSPTDLKLQMEREGLDKSQDEYKQRMSDLMAQKREESPLDYFSGFTAIEIKQLKEGKVSSALLEKVEDALIEIENNPNFNQPEPIKSGGITSMIDATRAFGAYNKKTKSIKPVAPRENKLFTEPKEGGTLINEGTKTKDEIRLEEIKAREAENDRQYQEAITKKYGEGWEPANNADIKPSTSERQVSLFVEDMNKKDDGYKYEMFEYGGYYAGVRRETTLEEDGFDMTPIVEQQGIDAKRKETYKKAAAESVAKKGGISLDTAKRRVENIPAAIEGTKKTMQELISDPETPSWLKEKQAQAHEGQIAHLEAKLKEAEAVIEAAEPKAETPKKVGYKKDPTKDGYEEAIIIGDSPKKGYTTIEFGAGIRRDVKSSSLFEIAEPKAEEPKAVDTGDKQIGRNTEGEMLYEDENGARYYLDSGFAISEPIAVSPMGATIPTNQERFGRSRFNYLTKEEFYEINGTPLEEPETPKETTKQKAKALYDAMPTEKKRTAGTQNGLDLEGTQNSLFDTESREDYIVPKWAEKLITDTTRYEDVITAVATAKEGAYNDLASRAIEAYEKSQGTEAQTVEEPSLFAPNDATINKKENEDEANTGRSEGAESNVQPISTGDKPKSNSRSDKQPSRAGDGGLGNNDTTIGAIRQPSDVSKEGSSNTRPDAERKPRNQFTINQNEAVTKGEVARFNDNYKAIKLIKENKSFYTKEELEALSRYTGWGGITKAFPNLSGQYEDGWKERGVALKAILTEEEYNNALASILDAFYTPPEVINTMWDISQRLGFDGGNVLEPSVGTGRFIGMVPQNIKSVAFDGIELDGITSKIASILYPRSHIRNIGFEKTNHTENFEMVIGNPPYGNFTVFDPTSKPLSKLSIHNYFVVKSLQAVKAGGVVNFVVTTSFMENLNKTTADMINEKAKLVGAIRLPNNVFKGAGTAVSTDIIIFQKLQEGEEGNIEEWYGKETLPNGLTVNKYFANNPTMMLGEWVRAFRGNALKGDPETYQDDLAAAVNALPKNIMYSFQGALREQTQNNSDKSIPSSVMYEKDGVHYVNIRLNENVEAVKVNSKIAKPYIPLRDALKDVITLQNTPNTNDAALEAARAKLNKTYEDFVKANGELNKPINRNVIVNDNYGYTVLALELNGKKAPIFTVRTAKPEIEVRTTDTKEALTITLNRKGNVDIAYLQEVTSKSEETIIKELEGVIFYDAIENKYVPREVFLSGDVKSKLEATHDQKAIDELLKVIPQDLEAKDIPVQLGASWVSPKYIEEYAKSELGFRTVDILYDKVTGRWSVTGYSHSNPFSIPYQRDALVLEKALNSRKIIIKKKVDGKEYVNEEETAYANQKLEDLKDHFSNWIFSDAQRAKVLVPIYNELFNRNVVPNIDKSAESYVIPNLQEPEFNSKGVKTKKGFKPRKHQRNAVYRAVYGNSPLLLNHPVGSGKTLTSQMIAMEWKRLGVANKPVIVTLKSVVPQFAKEFKEAYPNANLLVPTETDFSKENRRKLLSAIATGDYDAIIITHDNLKELRNPEETVKEVLEERIAELEESLENIEGRGKTDVQKKIKKLKQDYEDIVNTKKNEDVLSFSQLGIDGIIVDESHKFKKIGFSSALDIKGIDTEESQMAVDLLIKTRHILKTSNNVVLMTGTPITNTLPELYAIQKLLQPELLKQQKIYAFDSWANQYSTTETDVEVTGTGGFKEITRIKSYENLDALYMSVGQIMDTVTNKEVQDNDDTFKLPKIKGGEATLVILPPSEEQEQYVEELKERLLEVNNKDNPDNYLVIFGDGQRMSLDIRFVIPDAADSLDSKANAATDRAVEIYKRFAKDKGTQLIFSDTGIPNAKGNFDLYNDIKKKLIAKGIPANEIALISDYDKSAEKKELSRKVNAGEIRFVIGSTQKLGTGINMQERLVAVHHLDIPYTPAELEQRNGRIIRQGNALLEKDPNFEVEILYYATEKTLDGTKWQILKNKLTFIQQFQEGNTDIDLDIDEGSAKEQADRMIALSTGNPLLLDRVKAEKKLKKLRSLKRGFNTARADNKNTLARYEEVISSADGKIANITADMEQAGSPIRIGGKTFKKTADMGQAILDEIIAYKQNRGMRQKIIGSVGTMDIQIDYNYKMETAHVYLIGKTENRINIDIVSQGDLGMGQKMENMSAKEIFQKRIDTINYEVGIAQDKIPTIKKALGESFAKQDELEAVEAELASINEQMKEEAAPQPKNSSPEDAKDGGVYDSYGENAMVNQELTKFQKKHLEILRARAGNPRVLIANKVIRNRKGNTVAGQYRDADHTVLISKGYGGTYRVIYHELVHALYAKITNDNKEFAKELFAIKSEVRNALEAEGVNIDEVYGMTDMHEFLAEFFSSVDFRAKLDSMPYTKQGEAVKGKTMLDKVLEFLRKILGKTQKQGTVTDEIKKLLAKFNAEAETIAQAHAAAVKGKGKVESPKAATEAAAALNMEIQEAPKKKTAANDPMREGFIDLTAVLSSPSRGVNLIKNKLDEVLSDHLTGKIKDTALDNFIRRYLGGSMAGLGMLTRKQEQQFTRLYRKMKADISKGEMSAEAAAKLIEEHFGKIDKTVFETIMGTSMPLYLGTTPNQPAPAQLNDALYKQMYNAVVIRYLENPSARDEIAGIFPDLANELDMVRDYIDTISKEAMSRGILLPSQYNKWEGKYLSRLYLIQNNKLDQEVAQTQAGIKMGKIQSGRKIESIVDFVAEFPQRAQELGVVLDPELMVKMTIAKTQGIMGVEEFFRNIAYETEVINARQTISLEEPIASLPITFSPYYATNRIIPYINDMINNLEREMEEGDYNDEALEDFQAYIENLRDEQKRIKEEAFAINTSLTKEEKERFAKIPEDIRYGAIAGLPVSKDLASLAIAQFHIVNEPEVFSTKLDKAGSKYLTFFKWAKVPANIYAYPRNLASNQFQWAMSGADPVTFGAEWLRSLNSYVTKDEWYNKARAEGLIDDNQMTFEVNQELKRMLQDLQVQGKGAGTLAKINKVMQWVGDKYGAIDDIAKIARMRYAVETDGKTLFEGAMIAQDTHYDYGLTYEIVRAIRDPNITRAVLGKLFFTLFPTYLQKTTAFVYESMIHRPFTMASIYAAILLIMNYDTDEEEAKAAMTEKEWEAFQKSIPDWIKHSPFIRTSYVQDKNGEWLVTFSDIGNVIPFGTLAAGASAIATGNITVGLSKLGAGGSPFLLIGDLVNNKDSFTGKQIYYPHDGMKKAEGIAKHLATTVAPATITRTISLVESQHPKLPRIAGVNTYVYSMKDLKEMKQWAADQIKIDAGKQAGKYRGNLRRAKAKFDKGEMSVDKYLELKEEAEENIAEWKEQGQKDYKEESPAPSVEIDFKNEVKYSQTKAKELRDLMSRAERSVHDKELFVKTRKSTDMAALKQLEEVRNLVEKEVRAQKANLKILSTKKMSNEDRTKWRKKINGTIDKAYEIGLKKTLAIKKKYGVKE